MASSTAIFGDVIPVCYLENMLCKSSGTLLGNTFPGIYAQNIIGVATARAGSTFIDIYPYVKGSTDTLWKCNSMGLSWHSIWGVK